MNKLSDSERKILRILWNRYKSDWVQPDPDWVCRISGKSIGDLRAILRALVKKGYVEVREKHMRIIRGWEPEAPRWMPMD